jgi:hypothetical protein
VLVRDRERPTAKSWSRRSVDAPRSLITARSLIATGVALLALSVAACGGGGGGGSGREAAVAGAAGGNGSAGSGSSAGGTLPGGGTLLPGADSQAAFGQTVFPLSRQFCVQCHAGAGPGFPQVSHPDEGTAYRAVIDNQKVNLTLPVSSRMVQRLLPERHFCWSDCASDAAQMEAAIALWASMVLDPNAPTGSTGGTGSDSGTGPSGEILSATRSFSDAAPAESGRDESNAIALYEFESGAGDVALDSSGVGPAMDLQLQGDVQWLSGGGIDLQGGRAFAGAATAVKLFNRIASGSGSQQYSLEAWIVPANTSQEGPARIVTYSDGTRRRNFMLGQVLYNYVYRNRSMALGIQENGTPDLITNNDDEDLQARLQHAVVTFDPVNGRRIYVDGVFTDDVDGSGPGLLVNWNPGYAFVLGNETSNSRPWIGQMRLAAIYDVALSPSRILANFQAGANQKFTLQLGIDAFLDPGSYVEFEVSEFDAFSYLFCNPTLVTQSPSGFSVEGLRLVVNGVAPVASQSFADVNVVVDEPRERLSSLCSVVPKDLGAQGDRFQLRFEVLAGSENRIVEPPPPPPVNNDVAEARPDIGIRDFDQVNNTLARVTGVDVTMASVQSAFDELREQLPESSDVRSFVSSQQVAISKLALEYCDLLVETPSLRQAFFGAAFQFDAPVPTAFVDQTQRDLIIRPLVDRTIGSQLASQPQTTDVEPILNGLLDDLTAGCTAASCDAVRTRTVVKGLCASVLSSAAAQLQ